MRKLTIFISLIALVCSLAFSAFGAVLDPYEYGDVVIDGDLELVKIKLPTDDMTISAFVDGKRAFNVQGPIAQFPWSMAKVDNLDLYCYPFGYEAFGSGTDPSAYTYVDNVFPLDGIPSGSSLDGSSQLLIGIMDATQTCDVYVSHNMILFDKSMSQIKSIELYKQSLIDWNGINAAFHTSWSVSTDDLAGCSYFSVVSHVELNGVDVESDNSTVFIDCRTNLINLVIPYSQLYQLQQQGEKTNQLLQQIDSAMQENGQKLDDVINEQQNTNNKLDDIMNNTVPSVRPDGQDKVDDLDDAESGLRDDASSGLDEGLGILVDALDILVTYTQAFSALGLIFGYFAGIPFFSALLYISFALGILATILGVGLSVASRFGNSHSNREGKSSRR